MGTNMDERVYESNPSGLKMLVSKTPITTWIEKLYDELSS